MWTPWLAFRLRPELGTSLFEFLRVTPLAVCAVAQSWREIRGCSPHRNKAKPKEFRRGAALHLDCSVSGLFPRRRLQPKTTGIPASGKVSPYFNKTRWKKPRNLTILNTRTAEGTISVRKQRCGRNIYIYSYCYVYEYILIVMLMFSYSYACSVLYHN